MTKGKIDNIRFTRVDHAIRGKYDLTMNEYALADSIYQLEIVGKTGICYASKDYLSNFLNLSRKTAINLINKLVEKGLVNRIGGDLRTTDEWKSNFKDKQMDFDDSDLDYEEDEDYDDDDL